MTVITPESALSTIFDKRNKRRKIWTATILLDRMGISHAPTHYSHYDRGARRRAKKVLHELWLQRKLLRKLEPDTRNLYLAGAETAYFRPADAPQRFLVPCSRCLRPCRSDVNQDQLCEQCKGG